STGLPCSETAWPADRRGLRVATMGRFAARLTAQIRKYVIGILAAVISVALVFFGPLEQLELLLFDQLFELRGIRPPTSTIVIFTIDESSFQELHLQWTFPPA